MNWQRWNTASHIFELSINDGGSWSALPLDASILNQGTVATARLGSGTANNTKYLRGDQAWTVPQASEIGGTPFTRAQLPSALAYEDEANVFTLNQLISKTRPEAQLLHSGTAKGRLAQAVANSCYTSSNLSFDGTNWNLDDTSLPGWLAYIDGTGSFAHYKVTAGANPRTLVSVWSVDNAGIETAFTINLTGGQIQFPNTQNASTNANTLDDYEEGIWTPADVSGAGLSVTQQITGQYVKIGQLVLATWGVLYPATGSGLAAVLSLPFTPQGTQFTAGVMYNTSAIAIEGICNASIANMQFYAVGGGSITNANLSGKDIRGTAMYRAST